MLKPVFAKAAQRFGKDQAPRLAAALTFYMMLALSPLLLFLISAVGLIQTSDRFRHMLLSSIRNGFGPNDAEFVRTLLHKAADTHAGIIAAIFGLIVAVYGASGLFEQLRDSVNAIWGVTPVSRGIWQIVLGKLSAFLMVIIGGAIVFAWVLFDAWLRYVHRHTEDYSSSIPIWQVVSFLSTWGVAIPVFGLMFKYLPCKYLKWSDVWFPAFLTGLLFAIGKYGLGLYLLLGSANSSYGAAGSVVIILLWAFYSAQIFFFGVELSEQYALHYGSQRGKEEEHKNAVLPSGVAKVSGERILKS